jgi:hypothetical protein
MKKIFILLLLGITMMISCNTPPPTPVSQLEIPVEIPAWVTQTETVFPNSQWITSVDWATDISSAISQAVSRLAQTFRVDLEVVTSASSDLSERVSTTQGRRFVETTESSRFVQEVTSSTALQGLIGMVTESWTHPETGRVYAIARINRAEGANRYDEMIRENDRIIGHLLEEASTNENTFESVQMLRLAHNLAEINDNFLGILSVLDPTTIGRRPTHGNAEILRTNAQNALARIIISVNVTGDINNRITTAFTEVLNNRGFRTITVGDGHYSLTASFEVAPVDVPHPTLTFVRYTLNYSLIDPRGVVIFSNSETAREGHNNLSEAINRSVITAEGLIGTTGFADRFDALIETL